MTAKGGNGSAKESVVKWWSFDLAILYAGTNVTELQMVNKVKENVCNRQEQGKCRYLTVCGIVFWVLYNRFVRKRFYASKIKSIQHVC